MPLFVRGLFRSHAERELSWKINCDALSDEDLETIAEVIAKKFNFSRVVGIPTGGERLAAALQKYCLEQKSYPILLVDDVLTTGGSMETERKKYSQEVIGFVIFARGPCPNWIHVLCQLPRWAGMV